MSRSPLPRVVLAALATGACLLALAACAKTPTPTPTGTTAGVGSLGTAAPTASARPGPTSAAAATYPNTAEDYAKAAVAAWAARDLIRLDQLEVQDGQLHTLYQCNGCYEIHFTLVNCQGANGSTFCLFFNNVGDSLRLRLVNQFLGEPRAIGNGSIWEPITFPSDDKAYAQEALNAWLAGNDARLNLLTATHMTSAQVSALGANNAAQWAFGNPHNPYDPDGAGGHSYYTFNDGAGHTLAFQFVDPNLGPPAPTTGAASQHRIEQIRYSM
jgi:hypothetical protein